MRCNQDLGLRASCGATELDPADLTQSRFCSCRRRRRRSIDTAAGEQDEFLSVVVDSSFLLPPDRPRLFTPGGHETNVGEAVRCAALRLHVGICVDDADVRVLYYLHDR